MASALMASTLGTAWIAAIVLVSGASQTSAWGQAAPHGPHDVAAPAQPGPAGVKIEFENDSVLVLRMRMEPREKTPMHDLGARVVVWLTDTHLRDTSPEGISNEVRRSVGAVDWVPPQRHSGENLGDKPIEWLAIVPKTKEAARP
jgi:hypothetical protein